MIFLRRSWAISSQKIPAEQKLLEKMVQAELWGKKFEQVLSTSWVLFLMFKKFLHYYCTPKKKCAPENY